MTWMNRATSPRWASKVKIETGRTRAGGGSPEIPIPDAVPGNGGRKKGRIEVGQSRDERAQGSRPYAEGSIQGRRITKSANPRWILTRGVPMKTVPRILGSQSSSLHRRWL